VNQSASSHDIEIVRSDFSGLAAGTVDIPAEYERAVEHVVDECFLAVGQAIGMRMTMDYDAVLFLRDHYRAKFLSAMSAFGNRWTEDRQNVTSVAMLFGERAVRYAADRTSIDLESTRKAAADVERYCKLHSRRAGRAAGTEGGVARIAGYWCTDDNP
jgi:hypothetical protein